MLMQHKSRSTYILPRVRRFIRNQGWFHTLWTEYSGKRFKQTIRVSKATFNYILLHIRDGLERRSVCEEPISPEERLAIALYKFGRGDYNRTVSEMSGYGESTIREITIEVANLIVEKLWPVHVKFPNTKSVQSLINEMNDAWQFPGAYAAIDGCHISIKCPPGGAEARKEYYNFKNFYSLIMMGIIDSQYRFLWASTGLPGCVHDSMVFKSSLLYQKLKNGESFPDMYTEISGVKIPPLILGDSAFPHHSWLQKRYTHANLNEQEEYFNYRFSRGRMVAECCYGQFKGRCRILYRKSEYHPETLKSIILACIVLHNTCIDKGDAILSTIDFNFDGSGRQLGSNLRTKLNMFQGKSVAR